MRGCFLDAGSMGDALNWDELNGAINDWQWYHNTTREQVGDRIAGMDIVITNKVVLDAAVLEAADNLKLICVAATGFNNVDTQAAAHCDIPVVNVTGYATPAVSQHVLAVMLGFALTWGLTLSPWEHLARFADPVMVLIIAGYFLPMPIRMVKGALRELMFGEPVGSVRQEVVQEVAEFDIAEITSTPISPPLVLGLLQDAARVR